MLFHLRGEHLAPLFLPLFEIKGFGHCFIASGCNFLPHVGVGEQEFEAFIDSICSGQGHYSIEPVYYYVGYSAHVCAKYSTVSRHRFEQ